jgi:hypothetical protein
MEIYHKLGRRLLLCILASIGFLLVRSLGVALGHLAGGGYSIGFNLTRLLRIDEWISGIVQFPWSIAMVVLLLLSAFRKTAGMITLGVGCFVGAFVSSWINMWPVDYSEGYPVNYSGGYINGGMVELFAVFASIVLAVIIQTCVSKLVNNRE